MRTSPSRPSPHHRRTAIIRGPSGATPFSFPRSLVGDLAGLEETVSGAGLLLRAGVGRSAGEPLCRRTQRILDAATPLGLARFMAVRPAA